MASKIASGAENLILLDESLDIKKSIVNGLTKAIIFESVKINIRQHDNEDSVYYLLLLYTQMYGGSKL